MFCTFLSITAQRKPGYRHRILIILCHIIKTEEEVWFVLFEVRQASVTGKPSNLLGFMQFRFVSASLYLHMGVLMDRRLYAMV
jgi:hypothetical protein